MAIGHYLHMQKESEVRGMVSDSLSGGRIMARGCWMWTKKNRRIYDRSGLRYPSGLTDREWAQVAPLIPPAKRGGRRREVMCVRC